MDEFNFYLLIFPAIFAIAWIVYAMRPKNESEKRHSTEISRNVCITISNPNNWNLEKLPNGLLRLNFPNHPFSVGILTSGNVHLMVYREVTNSYEAYRLSNRENSEIQNAIIDVKNRVRKENKRIEKENNRILAKEVNESFGSTKDDIRKKMNSSFENPIISRIKKLIPIIGKNK